MDALTRGNIAESGPKNATEVNEPDPEDNGNADKERDEQEIQATRATISSATSTQQNTLESTTLDHDTSGLSTDDVVISEKVNPELHEEIFQHRPVKAWRWDVEQNKWRGRGKG
eukprot:203899_1